MQEGFKLGLWNYLVIGFKGLFGGGWASIVEYVATIFTEKVLAKCDAELLKKWSEVFEKFAEFLQFVVDRFVSDEKKKTAADATIAAIKHLAAALKDGELTADEINAELDKVYAAVDAWKAI